MIQVKELKKSINGKIILDIPDLAFDEGKVIGIIGKNGSGKSTLLRIILDMIKPSAGDIFIDSKANNLSELWKKQTGAYLDEDFLINFLLPEEYFELLFKLRNKTLKAYPDFIISLQTFFDNEILNQKKTIGNFSKGNRQKIGIAGALIGDIKRLILDEPLSNLDIRSQHELKRLLKAANREQNLTIIMTSHDPSLVENFFDILVTIQDGKVIEKSYINKSDSIENRR
jgi:ABC-2 type transport system ATP-binding protein